MKLPQAWAWLKARRACASDIARDAWAWLADLRASLAFVSAGLNAVWYCALVLLVAGGALSWPAGWWTHLQLWAFGFSSAAIWFIDHVVDADGSGT